MAGIVASVLSLVLGKLHPFEPDSYSGGEVGRKEVGLAIEDDVEEGRLA